MRHSPAFPWSVTHGDHLLEHPARMLRTLRRRRDGATLSEVTAAYLDRWLSALTAHALVVGYAPRQGFFYVPRASDGGEPSGYPIRSEPLSEQEAAAALRRLPTDDGGVPNAA